MNDDPHLTRALCVSVYMCTGFGAKSVFLWCRCAAHKLELQFANKDDLLAVGKEKREQNLMRGKVKPEMSDTDTSEEPTTHGKTAPGKTLLSNTDKSVDVPHDTRQQPVVVPEEQSLDEAKRAPGHAVEVALKTWPEKTQQEIADQVGCSIGLVSKVKQELFTDEKLTIPPTRTGKDGKERPTTYARREPEQIVNTPPMPL